MNCPVPHTCPTIDRCIKDLKTVEGCLSALTDIIDSIDNDTENINLVKDLCIAAKGEILESYRYVNIYGDLEIIREANSELRDWGYKLKAKLEEYEQKIN